MEVKVEYLRCPNCSYVYEATEDHCPQCGKDTIIDESLLEERVFNLND